MQKRILGHTWNNKSIRVSRKKEISECLFSSNSKKISSDGLTIRITGSAALDLAYVAAGRYDGIWLVGLKEWDIAAGALLVKEAGGHITDDNGNSDFFATGNIIAATPKVHEKVTHLITNSK